MQEMADSLDATLDQHFGPLGAITVLTFLVESAGVPARSTPLAASPVSVLDTSH
jgi:hypothetical protein